MARRPLGWLAVSVAALSWAGCGNERNRPLGLAQLGPPVSLVNFTVPSGDVSFGRPSTWTVTAGTSPEVAQISSGGAVATIFAYPRSDLPLDRTGAETSRQKLLRSLRQRAPSFQVRDSRVIEVNGAPAVEIFGEGRIAGHRVKTRSVHVYKGAAEYVVDAYARPRYFRRADPEAFGPLLATIRLGGFPEGPPTGGTRAPG
jgi:hypothetical protein